MPSSLDSVVNDYKKANSSTPSPTQTTQTTSFSSQDHGITEATLEAVASREYHVSDVMHCETAFDRQSVLTIQPNDPRLDPGSQDFSFHLWVLRFMSLLEREGHRLRKSGFSTRNLNVNGTGRAIKVQETIIPAIPKISSFGPSKTSPKRILRNINVNVSSGEMLIVLGRPGAGCSTFLKTLCGELHGLILDKETKITYDGAPQVPFLKEFKGSVVYNQETEKHFPHLTVGQTLEFAASCRTPAKRILYHSRKKFAEHTTAVVMKIFGLSHTKNTKVGNDYIRGVSGGERKRVSIAEMVLAGPSIAAWDNSTRGLDSATALEFIKSLRTSSVIAGLTHAVAIYQASQSIYNLFDKCLVLYEGRQIYFGDVKDAQAYFENMGYHCPPRQTTADFLTAVTNPHERRTRPGFSSKIPRTPDEFAQYWHDSKEYEVTMSGLDDTVRVFGTGETNVQSFRQAHQEMQANHTRPKSPYIISIPMQIRLCVGRAYQRIWNNKSSTISTIAGQVIQALIVGSVFYGLSNNTDSLYSKASAAFIAILLSALQSIVEINDLYEQRPIVAKHQTFAFYHPWTEAAAGIVADIPIKLIGNGCFLIILYFLAGLRYAAAQFFVFFLFCFVAMLTMSMIFRTIAASTKQISQAFAIAGVMVLWIAVYTGFAIQKPYMKPWFKWSTWINPVSYAYEAVLVNEAHAMNFPCAPESIIPPYGTGNHFACAIAGSTIGSTVVNGDAWVESSYGYSYAHIWRNLGILIAFLFVFLAIYLTATELNSRSSSTSEVLVFRQSRKVDLEHQDLEKGAAADGDSKHVEVSEQSVPPKAIEPQTGMLTWKNLTLDVKIKDENRRLLDGVSGWIEPGSLTALMGTSGAGKTTLLDTLSQRMSVGVIGGEMLVNGNSLGVSFQREIGYVQQQDLHLETTTVREALQFSAILRQPHTTPKQEKLKYVEELIGLLKMEPFADAVVGVPGEGLNVEQRKLLSIAVEMAAKPALLLFLDEPTSGLDSQSSWGIVTMLRRLADSGQAILCTIHQPSALLFQQFDRLLFLARGGKTVYFGDIGQQSRVVLEYFEREAARKCGEEENPAEYLLEVVGKLENHDWAATWKNSAEAAKLQDDLAHFQPSPSPAGSRDDQSTTEFAMPLTSQIHYVTKRVFSQYWRTPDYIRGKFTLVIAAALFIGFTFYKPQSSRAGLQNLIFALFMLTAIFSTLVQQIMPRFVIQRSLYEVRERPSKVYSWFAFLFANIVVEIPYQIVLAVMAWASWYFPVFGKNNSSEEMGLMLLFVIEFMIFASTFAQMVIATLPDAPTAGNVSTLLFSMMIVFCGVLQPPSGLPGFWYFMYRVSPLTYLIGGWAGTSISHRLVHCAQNELAIFDPPPSETCAQYLAPYFLQGAIGTLSNPNATAACAYCPLSNGAQYLAGSEIYASERWRNFGLMWVYIVFNVLATVLLYYVFRVRRFSASGVFERFRGIH